MAAKPAAGAGGGSNTSSGPGGSPRAALDRAAWVTHLQQNPFVEHDDAIFKHGRAWSLVSGGAPPEPTVRWACSKPPRDDHDAPAWLTATEYADEAPARLAKVRGLAELLRLSRKTVVYTGAGISAAVIGQAARSGVNTVGFKQDTRTCTPTFTHRALAALGRRGFLHGWVQQNHDGLPQKAGFQQELINEIHGSWYDPSNPVVKYSGSLHERMYPWMREDARTADLVLVIGTSLGGLNADQVAVNAAERSLAGGGLGTVCINLQQTEQDGKMSLRLFGKSDGILNLLLQELDILPRAPAAAGSKQLQRELATTWPKGSRVLVPYGADGRRLPAGAPRMVLDLRDGQRVQICPGHNIQGAQQPVYMHIGQEEPRPTKYGGVVRQPGPGHGAVVHRDEASGSFVLQIEGVDMRLGVWWLEAAVRGGVDALPLVNLRPTFEAGVEAERRQAAAEATRREQFHEAAAQRQREQQACAKTANGGGGG